MQKFAIDEINTIVAKKFKDNEMKSLFSFLSNQINLENDVNKKNKLLILKAECYQRIGNLLSAQVVLESIDNKFLSREDSINVHVLKLKVSFQKGDWNKSLDTSKSLIEQYNISMGNVLWRTSMLYAIFNDGKECQKYSDRHKEMIEHSGFQEANNIVYTKTVPLLLNDNKGTSLLRVMSPVENAKDIYLKSNINFDTRKRIGSRLKSFCQAILIEAFIEWDYGNKYDAYELAILSGLCMAYSKITLEAEGIGEIVKLFCSKYKTLISIINLALNSSEEVFYIAAQKYEDFVLIKRAYIDAIYRFEDIITDSVLESEKEPKNIDSHIQKNQLVEGTKKLPGEQIKKFL